MKTRILMTAAALIALTTVATASATLPRSQTTPTTSTVPPPITVVLKRNSLTLTEGKKIATVQADRITRQRDDKNKPADGSKKEIRYRLSGGYHIVSPQGWEWTGRDADLILTDITSSRGRIQSLVVVSAIGPMHQRRPVTAPDGTKTIEEHDITVKPLPPGETAGISFYINAPTYVINSSGKEEIHYDN